MASANDILRDRAILHAIQTERLTVSEIRKIEEALRQVDSDLVKRIRARGVDGTWTTARLNRLLASIRKGQRKAYRELRQLMLKDLRAIVDSEIQFGTGSLDIALKGTTTAVAPTQSQIMTAAALRPYQGRKMSEWFSDLASNKIDAIESNLRMGVIEGDNPRQIINRVRQAGITNRNHARAIARTTVNHYTTTAKERVYMANDDVIKGVQWLSTLDGRTSDICKIRDGDVFPIGVGPRPPAHVNCRSTTIPVTKSFKELGLPFEEFPESTRASIDGQVSESLNYGEWLRDADPAIQDQALGKTRAILFRKGDLEVDDFVDFKGRRYTLQELQTREKAAFEKAGLG